MLFSVKAGRGGQHTGKKKAGESDSGATPTILCVSGVREFRIFSYLWLRAPAGISGKDENY